MLKRVPVTTKAEVERLYPLVKEIWQEVFTEMIGAENVTRMLAEYQSPVAIWEEINAGVAYFVLENREGKPVGYTAYSLEKPGILYISKLYLHKSLRGQGQMRFLFSWYDDLAQKTQRRQQLRVNQNNQSAINIYKHQGFQIMDSLEIAIAPGLVMNDYVLEK